MRNEVNDELHWIADTVSRTQKLGKTVLKKASERKIEWPEQIPCSIRAAEGSEAFTSIDDAFASVMHSLATATRQCKKFYRTCNEKGFNTADKNHCCRFHMQSTEAIKNKNPLVMSEDVHMLVHPGTYSVSAADSGSSLNLQTHVVHLVSGQSVAVNFKL